MAKKKGKRKGKARSGSGSAKRKRANPFKRKATRRKSGPRAFSAIPRARRRSGGSGSGLSFSGPRSLTTKAMLLALAGAVAGGVAANQLAPRIAVAMDGKYGTSSNLGQAALKVGIGVAGGYGLSKLSKPLGVGFVLGAVAEPGIGFVRSKIAQMESQARASGAKPSNTVAGLMGGATAGGMAGLSARNADAYA